MPVVERPHAAIYYEACGEGPPVVFAHGAGGNTLVWWQQVPIFARHYRVLTFDHRGFGRSRCEAGFEQGRYFADDLAAVLDDAGVTRAALVCQSMGGWTGMQFARAHRDRVAALVLSGTPAGLLTQKVMEALATLTVAASQMEREPAWDEAHPALAADVFARDPERGFLYAQLAGLNPRLDLGRLALHELMTAPADLATWSIPTLVLGGEHDRLFAPEILADVAAAIPCARFTSLPYAGHSPYFETPGEFNRIVGEFLDEHWPRT